MKQNSVSRKKLQNTNQSKGITNKTKKKKTKHKSNNSTMINKTIKKTIKSNTNINYTLSEVIDDTTYTHFKSLIKKSPDLCKGQTGDGKCYKIRKSLLKDMKALKKDKHYRILYIHNNKEIIAYISTKLYSKDGGFMFIHKERNHQKMSLKERMILEVSKSVDIAYKLCDLLDKYNIELEVHADINTDPNFKSNVALKEAMGYIMGMGFTFKAKPNAFASSSCADKMI